jgi:hypothetical protein
MDKLIDLMFFKIRYNLFILYKKLVTKRSRKYIMFFVGRYPDNFKHGLKPILDNSHGLKWVFGPASIIIIFNSKEKLKYLDKFFKKMYSEYAESFFLFDVTKGKYSKHVIEDYYKHLYSDEPSKHNDITLNKIQYFIDMVSKAREEYIDILNEEIRYANEEKENNDDPNITVDMDLIDSILDKIIEHGYSSLTEKEKLILKKYNADNEL